MATANAVIVIDDGDDETENDESDSALKQKEEKIIALSEILHVSREQSKSALEGCGYDLQQAILAKLDHNLSRRTTKSLSIPAAVKTMVQRPLKTSLPVHAPAKLADPQGELSPQWQSCYQNSPTPFVDPQFTPTKTSLDGRRTAAGQSSKKDVVVLCHCQLPATSRTVQSDGPNYGRFFLVCGRPRSTNRGRRRRNDEQSDNNGNSSQTTAKNKPCNFFQWDKNGSLGGGYAATRWSHISWHLFAGTEYVVCRKKMGPEQIRQGAVGNCWFLSALAVVAEKEYLIRRVFPHTTTNEKGCYQVNLCLDGKWTSVVVDAHLPVVLEENDATTGKPTTTRSLQKQDFRGVALQNRQVAFPAFCAVPRGQLWPALVEKAYAKTHGSYANLSGGFIAEGLADLTGAPHETILFEMKDDRDSRDELWARLLSFFEAGFLMGVATSKGGDGLVGSHAYSILKVREIHGSVIGSQQKVTDFFAGSSSKKAKLENGTSRTNPRKETIRLLSIRNPWGKKEWQGAFSANSEAWTKRLRNELGKEWAQSDGTFWMQYDDVLSRFHHMDVCKTREGWVHTSYDGSFWDAPDILQSSDFAYTLRTNRQTWAFLSLVQPKKRANTSTRYWYCDLSMILMKRLIDRPDDDWNHDKVCLCGVGRRIDVEVFLDPLFEYCLLPLAGTPRKNGDLKSSFRLTVYSANAVESQLLCHTPQIRQAALTALHTTLLDGPNSIIHAVASQSLLLCVPKQRCLYFIGVNASSHDFLSLRLTVELTNGTLLTFGENRETHDIAPRSQRILIVVSSTGKQHSSTSLEFKYTSDRVVAGGCRSSSGTSSATRKPKLVGFGSQVAISEQGDSLTQHEVECFSTKGRGLVDILSWIPPLGTVTVY